MPTTFTIPKANSVIFTPIYSPSHNLFFQNSSQERTLSTGGQAADTHYNIERSADGSNGLCSSVSIQEVYTEVLNLGEGHATQVCPTSQYCNWSGCQQKPVWERTAAQQGKEQDFMWVVFPHPCMSMHKAPKRTKNTSDNFDALCIYRNGFERLTFLLDS